MSNRIRSSPILADRHTTADCYFVRQPCGKPFVGCSCLLLSISFFCIIHDANVYICIPELFDIRPDTQRSGIVGKCNETQP